MIPQQLKKNDFRFIIVGEDKKPIEKAWGKVNNYLYNDEKLLQHIENNKKYGVVCGYGNLIVVDFDSEEIQEQLISKFPDTFIVKTAGKGLYHLYYISDSSSGFRVNNIGGVRIADVQGCGTMVIGAGSNMSNGRKYDVVKDINISTISMETIKKIFSPWLDMERKIDKTRKESVEPQIKEIMEKIKIPQLLQQWGINTSSNPTDCPFHSSINHQCFSYTDTLWHCFHCDNGGTIINLMMQKNGLDFHTTKKKICQELGIIFNEVDLFIPNREEICENFYKTNPYFYDDVGIFWFWNREIMCYEMRDEYDLMNEIKKAAQQKNFSIVSNGFWGEVVRALKIVGRNHIPETWNPKWIQFNSKVYDIETGKIFDASPKYFNANPIPHNLGVDTTTPNIDEILSEWVGEEHLLEIKEICFYCMIQDYPIHRLFFLFGQGLNGKGKFLSFLTHLIGFRNVTSSNLNRIMTRSFETSKLYKKLICQMGETNFQVIEDTADIKQLTGQDFISAEFKGKDNFDFINFAKIIIATNCLPPTLDTTNGWYRRIKIIDFPNQFNEGLDPLLRIPIYEYDNFCKQLMNIGSSLLIRGYFTNDGNIASRQAAYESKSNPLQSFINSEFIIDRSEKMPYFKFYDKFEIWMKARKYRIMSKKEVSQLLEKDGYEIRSEHINIDGKSTKWFFIYGFKEKLTSGSDGSDGTPFHISFPYGETNSKSVSIASIASENEESYMKINNFKLNLLDAIATFDKNKGGKIEEVQKLMGCSEKDMDEYLKYHIKVGDIFESPKGTLRILS